MIRLSELAASVARGRRRRRRPRAEAPREIVPAAGARLPADPDPFDAARERLRARIPPRDDGP